MTEDLKFPPDTEVRMMVIHQQYLQQQNDQLLTMFKLHEYEIACLWAVVCGILVVSIWERHRLSHPKGR